MRRTKEQQPVVDLNALLVVSYAQLSGQLGVHRATLHRWSRSGVLPAPRRLGPGRVGWLASEILDWLRALPPVVGSKPEGA